MSVIQVPRKPLTLAERTYIPQIASGMWTTLKHIIAAPVTLNYPEQRPEIPPGYRGAPTLVRDPHGREKCVSCQLCEFVCPPKAIRITPGEIPADSPDAHPAEAARYYTRALYAQVNAAAITPDPARANFPKAEACHATLAQYLQNLPPAEYPESFATLALSHSALASGYGEALRLTDAQRHIDAIAHLVATSAESEQHQRLISYYAIALYNLLASYIAAADLPAAEKTRDTFRALAGQHPGNPVTQENYADATAALANAYSNTDPPNLPAAEHLLAELRSLDAAGALKNSNSYSLLLYNLVLEYAAAQDYPAAEQKYAELQSLHHRYPAQARIALRIAIAAYQLIRNYYKLDDLPPRIETKYNDIKILAATHATAPPDKSDSPIRLAKKNNNPLGLEIAIYQSYAAQLYASQIVLGKDKTQLPRIHVLLADMRAHAARWPATNPESKPIHDAITDITKYTPLLPPLPPQPPPFP